MAKLASIEASGEGFRLLTRKPVTFLVWVLFWSILAMGPLLAVGAGIAPRLLDLFDHMRAAHGIDDEAVLSQIFNFELGLGSLLGPWVLWVFVVSTIFYAAIYRAVLEPAKSSFAYLRVGADEVRLFVTTIALAVLWIVYLIALTALFVGLCILANRIGDPWTGWIVTLGVIALLCALFVAPFRFSLSLPMTFAEKKIRIFESWRLTAGNFWRIVGMWLMTLLYVIIVAVVAGIIQQLVFFLLGWGTGGFNQLDELAHIGDDFRKGFSVFFAALGPALIGYFIVQSLAGALMRVVLLAPFARAYAQLSGRDAPANLES